MYVKSFIVIVINKKSFYYNDYQVRVIGYTGCNFS